MGGYILKRLVSAIPVLLGITIIVFLIMSLIPGDPATAILGSYATPENVEKLNRDLGLDKPMVQRYFIWLGNMLTGDFGRSFSLNRPVLDEVLERFNATLILAGTAATLSGTHNPNGGTIPDPPPYSLDWVFHGHGVHGTWRGGQSLHHRPDDRKGLHRRSNRSRALHAQLVHHPQTRHRIQCIQQPAVATDLGNPSQSENLTSNCFSLEVAR